MQVAARTEVGYVRRRNEDALLVDEQAGVVLVADGLGGHPAGDLASQTAVADVRERLDGSGPGDDPGRWLADALVHAHERVLATAGDDIERAGMATTAVAAAVRGEHVWVVHVGDSRAYLRTGEGLRQVTQDHGLGGYITQALGLDRGVTPDVARLDVAPGDRLLVCSDGLTNMVDAADLDTLLGQGDVGQACDALVEAALANGGIDNVTVAVVEV